MSSCPVSQGLSPDSRVRRDFWRMEAWHTPFPVTRNLPKSCSWYPSFQAGSGQKDPAWQALEPGHRARHRKGHPRANPHATYPLGPLLSPAPDWMPRCQHCRDTMLGTGLNTVPYVLPSQEGHASHPTQGPSQPGAHSLLIACNFITLHWTACLTSW